MRDFFLAVRHTYELL